MGASTRDVSVDAPQAQPFHIPNDRRSKAPFVRVPGSLPEMLPLVFPQQRARLRAEDAHHAFVALLGDRLHDDPHPGSLDKGAG
jgi:hypothetical protein